MESFTSHIVSVFEDNEATKNLIDEESAGMLCRICNALKKENKITNLTAICDDEGILLKHFCDSAAAVPYIPKSALVFDIGCGGGFPSLVIASLRNDVSIISIDSVGKKLNSVSRIALGAGLKNLKTENSRAEVLGKDPKFRESADVVCARAVAELNTLAEFCLPLVKVGGIFIAMKAQSAQAELSKAGNAIQLLGGRVRNTVTYMLKNSHESIERTLVIIEKVAKTPDKYPRNSAQIAKKPL